MSVVLYCKPLCDCSGCDVFFCFIFFYTTQNELFYSVLYVIQQKAPLLFFLGMLLSLSFTNSSSSALSIHCCCLEHAAYCALCTGLHGVVTSFATSVFNFESLCLLNDTRYVHCVQVLPTVGGLFASHELHNAYWSRNICKMCFSIEFSVLRKRGCVQSFDKSVLAQSLEFWRKGGCVQSFEKKGMGFVNSVYR